MNPQILLKAELERRCRKNPRYSLRAFARSLGMSHTLLSLILSGKRPLSEKAAQRVSDVMQLNPRDRTLLVMERSGKKNVTRSMKDRAAMELDQFEFISDWHHYAILSLMETAESKWNTSWIARRLGIPEAQAKLAMERLVRLGLVARVGGRWKQTGLPLKFENSISTAGTRKHHAQILARAAESLENDPMEQRDFSGITFAMDPKFVSYAKERIRAFRRELSEELEEMGNASEVFELSLQLFPLSKIQSGKAKKDEK